MNHDAIRDQSNLRSQVSAWFRELGFEQVGFSKSIERITTHHMDRTLVYKLRKRADHDTFYKESTGGSLIVFEVTTDSGACTHDGYCPLLLFGIWEKKLRFKADAGTLFKYRAEGHAIEKKFLDFVAAL